MDSIDNNYEMIKDVRKELGKKEDANNAEAMRLEKKYSTISAALKGRCKL